MKPLYLERAENKRSELDKRRVLVQPTVAGPSEIVNAATAHSPNKGQADFTDKINEGGKPVVGVQQGMHQL